MKALITLAVATIVVLIAMISFAYSGLYDVSAGSSHRGPVRWLLSTVVDASIERHAGDIDVPDLTDEALKLAGVNDFDAMCAGCHGAPGQAPDATGQGLNPSPPDLAKSAAHLTPAELFWVTRHGVKMTGMPAWGVTHDDEALWPVVAFMTALPKLDAEAYRLLLAKAADHGHHGSEAMRNDHGDAGNPAVTDEQSDIQDDPSPAKKEESDHDGHDHAH